MGTVYYHGTSIEKAATILNEGFKEGTYFTWDLHSALVMGGMHIFAVYFLDKEITDYWEWISDKVISAEEILYYRVFSVECVYNNDKAREALIKRTHIERHGEDAIHCVKCKGQGQLNEVFEYGGIKNTDIIVCDICKGFGCLQLNNKPWNES